MLFPKALAVHVVGRNTEIAPLDPPSPKTPPIEPNMKWIGQLVAKIWPFDIFPRWRRLPSWIFSNRK